MSIKEKIKNLVQEEFKRLKDKGEVELSPQQKSSFGSWVKAKMSNTIPGSIKDDEVFDYIKQNPGSTKVSLGQLTTLFLDKEKIKSGLGKRDFDKQLDAVKTKLDATKTYTTGETDYDTIGKEFGVTKQRTEQIAGDAMRKLITLLKGGASSSDEQGIGSLLEILKDTTMQAANIVASIAANENIRNGEDLIASLGRVGIKGVSGIQDDPLIGEFVSYAKEVGPAQAAQVLIDDLLETSVDAEGGNDLKFFQDIVSAIIKKKVIEPEELAAGLRKKPGRKKKDSP